MTTISGHHALSCLDGAVRKGYIAVELLEKAGINPQLVSLPNARIYDDQMTLLVQNVWELLDDEFMGFTETPCKRGAFSYMLHSIRHCDNLREALTMATRFYNLMTNDMLCKLQESDDKATIIIDFKNQELDINYFYQTFWMVIWHRLSSWLCGISIPLISTSFTQPRPNHAHTHELLTIFPSENIFGTTSNSIVFSTKYLNTSLIRTKDEVNQFLIQSPYNLLTIPGNDKSLKKRVMDIVRSYSTGNLTFPPLQGIADRLNMSKQTMHRRLQEEASSYQKIKDDIRRDLALKKLIQEKRPVYEVAEIVGFSDARSFTRAFKQWTGVTPREYCKFL